ncbi:flavodoxin [Ruminococcus gauvreauii]|uniref:Flavodoxin n=1 Tax=Ruminococcus gauvreauii TaxID=438033 RepID=A0ABY5VL30_9FIRM|nr:flavodoxin [Ruminococcus gauvreauii]UWP61012.1 flavodoxin [Ruminococcus gauvreauii]
MSKSLVAYFSASGTTKRLAEKLAKEIEADLFEIQAETPYTTADLDWRNSNSRSSIEMNDRNCRPAIRSKAADMAQYELVFIGFPIWWYREPSIIDTFMESYDFSGKTLIPFATSGGSGMGDSGKNMAALAPGASVTDGRRFGGSVSGKELSDWAAQWDTKSP